MAVLRCFKDPCDPLLLRLILIVMILRTGTGNTLHTVRDSPVELNRTKYGINSFGFILHSTSLAVAAHGLPPYFGEFAHMAAIGWSQLVSVPLWNCGGSLIRGNYILTAAHCTTDQYGTAPDVVRVGDLNLYDASDDVFAKQSKIVEIIRHPSYVFGKKYHDIALLRLAKRLTLGVGVAPACLWNGDVSYFPSFEAVGWGDTGYLQPRSPVLLKVTLSPVDLFRCSKHYLYTHGLDYGLNVNQMCAGDEKMDTCPGDSGGPLQVKLLHNKHVTPFVVGVTSFGAACGFSVPGVYTRVAPYIEWIISSLKARGERVTESMFQPEVCASDYDALQDDPDSTNFSKYQNLKNVLVFQQQQAAYYRNKICADNTKLLCVY